MFQNKYIWPNLFNIEAYGQSIFFIEKDILNLKKLLGKIFYKIFL